MFKKKVKKFFSFKSKSKKKSKSSEDLSCSAPQASGTVRSEPCFGSDRPKVTWYRRFFQAHVLIVACITCMRVGTSRACTRAHKGVCFPRFVFGSVHDSLSLRSYPSIAPARAGVGACVDKSFVITRSVGNPHP